MIIYISVVYIFPCSFQDGKSQRPKGYIEAFGGTITNIEEVGKKRLAYEIQKMREGFYYFIQFDAESESPAQLEQRLRIMDNVLRYLCVRQEA